MPDLGAVKDEAANEGEAGGLRMRPWGLTLAAALRNPPKSGSCSSADPADPKTTHNAFHSRPPEPFLRVFCPAPREDRPKTGPPGTENPKNADDPA